MFCLPKTAWPPTLRVLENGYNIRVVDVAFDSVGVDTPEDLRMAEETICGRTRP